MDDASENGRFGIADYDQIEDESFPPLPPPLSPGEGNFDDDLLGGGEGDGEVSKLPDVPVAKRRTVRKPQPKLDSQRLLSDRGLPALRTLFSDVKFKGKGHEAEDLRVLMQKMENWAHRLYPKLQFEDFVDRLEVLGGKKEVQTCLKRIRLDMPLTHEDFTGTEERDEAEVPVQNDADPFRDEVFPEDPFVHSTPVPVPLSLTEEQQQRIELNKRRALERRLARQQQESSQLTFTEEPASSPTTHDLSNDHQEENTETETPSNEKSAVSPNSPLNNSDGPVPDPTEHLELIEADP